MSQLLVNEINAYTGSTVVINGVTIDNGVISATTYVNIGNEFTGGTVTGPTTFSSGLTATTISATTYQNLPTDIYVTGGTYSNGTATFNNNTGGTFNVTGFTTNGGSQFLNITYSGLVSAITGSTLSAGTYYLITDFRSCYDQPDFNSDGNAITTGNYKQAAIEPIMVFATSANTISTTAYQPAYPNDRIQYDWTFSTTEITSGVAYGRISERIDEFNNRTDYDHRTILFKRYKLFTFRPNQPLNGTIQLFNNGIISGTSTSFMTLTVGDVVYIPSTSPSYYEIVSITGNTAMTVSGDTITAIGAGQQIFPTILETNDSNGYFSYKRTNVKTNDFIEYTTFGDAISNDYAKNTYVGDFAYQNVGSGFILANNVFLEGAYESNKFGDYCYNNTFGTDNQNNIWGDYCYENVSTNDIDYNIIGHYFNNNLINVNLTSNHIGNDFSNNKLLAENSENFEDNIIENDFTNNTIYSWFYSNEILNNFSNNIIGDFDDLTNFQFYGNIIGTNFTDNIITDNFYKNEIGYRFYDNQISGETYTNRIGEQFETNTIYGDFYDNQIFNEFKGNITYQGFYENRVDFGFGSNEFSGNCSNNSFGPTISSNDFLGSVYSNIFKGGVLGNTIGDNFISNNIGFGFGGNIIGDNFGYGAGAPQGNIIGNGFIDNTIGEYFYNNSIPDNFYENEVGNYFQWNVINTNIDRTYFTLNYGNITGFSYTASGTGATDTVYTNLTGTTNGHGVSATFDVEVSGGTVTGVSGNTEGRLYLTGNTLTILGTQIGGVTGEISGFTLNSLIVKIYKPADSTYEFPDNETEMDYLIDNSPLFDTYYSSNIQGVSYTTKTGIDQNQYGMVIEGYIQIPSGSTYYFGLSSDDGSDAFINGIKVADWYGAHGDSGNVAGGNQYPITLTAGTYSVKVRLQQRSGQDIVSLLYSSDSGSTWNIIPNSWFPFSATGTTGSYPNIVAQGTGSGENATFDVTVVGGLVDSVVLNNGGGSYLVGETLTILGSDFGSTEDINIIVDSVYSDNIVITVTGVTSGSLFYDHYTKQIFERKGGNKRVSFYDEDDILNVDSIYTASGYIPVYSQVISFPLNNASFEFQCDGSYTNNASYTGNEVNNAQELVTLFNNNFRQIGYFFDNNDGRIGLYINPSLKQQYCPSGTYTIEVFND